MSASERERLLLDAIASGRLDEAASTDPELSETLAAHQELESLFEMLRQPALPKSDDEPVADASIGRYLLKRLLGKGGFGSVFLCRDPDLERLVAVKVLPRKRFASEAEADKFLEEARLTARLKHPAIVTVHDVGRDGEQGYIVLEYIQGASLGDHHQNEPLTTRRIAEIVATVADALQYAHKLGFVHRDLKPGNILIDEQGDPHVADFGLAVTEESQRGLAGQIAGTPAYMSPEQVRGEAHRLDGRTDIWSLGVILYQLLTGRQPFWTDTIPECLDNIQHKEPKPPRQIDEAIPRQLENVCLKCLAKDVKDRYTNAADVATDLRQWLDGGDDEAKPPSDAQVAMPSRARTGSRWPLLVVCGLVAAAAIAAIAIMALQPAGQDQRLAAPDDIEVTSVSDEVESLLRLAYSEKLSGPTPTATIKVEIDRTPESDDDWKPLSNGEDVSNSDSYRLLFKTDETAHVYVLQIDSSGKLDWLFPTNPMSQHSSGVNPVEPDTWVQVPQGDKSFFLLDETLGVEHLYVVVTRQRWAALEQAVSRAAQASTSSQPINKRFGLQSRGVGGTRENKSSLEQPIQGVEGAIVEEIWFQHVASP